MKPFHGRFATAGLCWLVLAFCCRGAADWPQWRGPHRDGHAASASPRVTALPKELQPTWKIAIGPGFSSPIVADGKVIYLDEQKGKEVVHALEAATGRELWQHELAEAFGDEWGRGPRSTPFVDGNLLFVQSCNGEFQCLALADGRLRWRINFADYGVRFLGSKANEGTASRRGNNGSGVTDESRVFVPVGSTDGATIVAFDKVTGKELWRTLNEETAYSSFIIATLAGVKQLVAFTADALVGVDRMHGRVLWRVPFRTAAKRHAVTPVIVGETVLVNSFTFGLAATRITKDGEELKATSAWANKALKINLSTPVLVGDFLYSQGAHHDYVCLKAATGKLVWSQPGFGSGTKDYASTIAVGKNLLVLTESGELFLLAAAPSKYIELGRLQVCGHTWCHPALADGRLYVRDGRTLLCLDLAAR